MFHTNSPLTILNAQAEVLGAHFPAVVAGEVDGVHHARIATRRLRETLPLTVACQRRHVVDDLRVWLKRIGRSLGQVRDIDIRIELLRYLETRAPHAAPSLVVICQRAEHDRLLEMRELIKHLERTQASRMLDALRAGGVWRARFGCGPWRAQLRRLLVQRAQAAREAIDHATGVYFPNRMHRARIAIKKFRYAAEIAQQAGMKTGSSLISELKKSQDILGELHDRQTLIDEWVGEIETKVKGPIDPQQVTLFVTVAEAECRELHDRFLMRRERLLELCACGAAENRPSARRALAPLTIVAVAAVAGLEAIRRHRGARRSPDRHRALEHESDVAACIPMAFGGVRTG